MLPILHKNSEEFKAVVQEAATNYGIAESMIEKDYWVTWCINYLFEYSPWKEHLGFKGGTCMAKAYDIIDRFSEDVDVLLDWRLLGYKLNEPLEPISKNKKNTLKHEMDDRTVFYLAEEMLPVISKDISNLLGSPFEAYISDNDKMSILFKYPKVFSHDRSILDDVKLEIGPMSQWSQLSPQPITSMIDKAIPSLNIFSPIHVLSVSPERTFWDKISILQNISHMRDKNPEKALTPRNSRHYYDVYRILNSPRRNDCIQQSDLFFATMDFSDRFYPVTYFDYKTVTLENVRLSIPDSLMADMRSDYETMKGMLYGDKPEFEEIYSCILDFQEQVHLIGETPKIHHNSLEHKINDAESRASFDKTDSKSILFEKER